MLNNILVSGKVTTAQLGWFQPCWFGKQEKVGTAVLVWTVKIKRLLEQLQPAPLLQIRQVSLDVHC